jgi:hypothetical protein
MRSRTLFFTVLLLLWAFVGCNPTPSVTSMTQHLGTDAGDAGIDAGAPGTDAGDAGIDAGAPGTDAGAPGTDAGACDPEVEYCPDPESGDPNLEPDPADLNEEICTTEDDGFGNMVTVCQPVPLCYCECRPAPNGVGRRLYWNNTCTQNSWPYHMPASGRCADLNLTQCRSVQSGTTTYDYYGSTCATSVAGVNRFCQ